jgi:hypothetical protein
MRSLGIALIVATIGCAANTQVVPATMNSNTNMVGPRGALATLSMIAEVDPVVEALAATPAGAWSQVAPAYADVGIPLSLSFDDQRLAGNQGFRVRREIGGVAMRNYLNCGSSSGFDNSEVYEISLNIATQVQPQADGTSKVATVLNATGTPMGVGSNSVNCSSTGALEERINDTIAKRLHLK